MNIYLTTPSAFSLWSSYHHEAVPMGATAPRRGRRWPLGSRASLLQRRLKDGCLQIPIFILGCKQFKIVSRMPGDNFSSRMIILFPVALKGKWRYCGKCTKFRIKMTSPNLQCKIEASHLLCQGLGFLTYKLGIMTDIPPTVPVMINKINVWNAL